MQRTLSSLMLLASLLLAFFVYYPGTAGYFIFDDTINILENTHIRIQSLDFSALKAAVLSGEAGILGRPLSVLSFALNYYFSNGLNPFDFKLTNIVIHLVNGLCIFIFSCQILATGSQRKLPVLTATAVRWIGVAVAAGWLMHPLNLTGVLYIVQRMTSLATLFTLLGLISYTHGRGLILRNQSGWGWVIASFALFTPLALLSKDNGALLPMFVLLTEIVFFRFHAPSPGTRRLLMALFGVAVFLPLVVVLGYTLFNSAWLTGGYAIRDFTLAERLMTEARVIWFYIRMILAPDISQFGLSHDDIPISTGLFEPVSTLFSCLGILALGLAAAFSIKRHPVAAYGVLFFLLGHSMESTVIPLELVHEHRNYLPDYGLLLVLFYYLLYPLRHMQSLTVRCVTAAVFVLMLAGITFLRATEWGDPVIMKEKEAVRHPNSIRANIDIGALYAEMPATSQAEADDFYQRAYAYYATAAELSPQDTLGIFGLISLHARRGMPIEESWGRALAGRIERFPFTPSTGNSIVSLEKCVSSSVCKLPPEVLESLIQAALRNSSLRGKARIQVLFAWSDFLFRVKNQPEAAMSAAFLAADANPQDMDNQITLINMLINMRKPVEAKRRIDQVRQLDRSRTYSATLDQQEAWCATLQEP